VQRGGEESDDVPNVRHDRSYVSGMFLSCFESIRLDSCGKLCREERAL
jgi:hypothetical protein